MLRLAAETPPELPGCQTAFILLQQCLRPRAGYLLRLLPAAWTGWLGTTWATLLRLLLGRLCQRDPADVQFTQACLPRRLGGLGFQHYGGWLPHLSRLSAIRAASATLTPLFPAEPLSTLIATSRFGRKLSFVAVS